MTQHHSNLTPSSDASSSAEASYLQVLPAVTTEYQIGKFRGDVMDKAAKLPKKISIGIFGFAGAGKSSFVNTAIRAMKNLPNLEFYALPSGPLAHGTLNYSKYMLSDKIQLYDSRGLNFIDTNETEEVLKFITGYGCLGYVSRSTEELPAKDKELIEKYRFEYQNNMTADSLNSVILTVPSECSEAEKGAVSNLIRLLKQIQYDSFLVLITKRDKGISISKEELIDSFSRKLQVDPHRIFVIQNYTSEAQERRVEDIDKMALKVIEGSLKLAERNVDNMLPFRKRFHLRREIGCLQKNSTIVLSVCVLCLALMLVLAVLYPNSKPNIRLEF